MDEGASAGPQAGETMRLLVLGASFLLDSLENDLYRGQVVGICH
jgi:hypothetical protein